MSEANKAIVNRFYEAALNNGDLNVVDEIVAADCILHNPAGPGNAQGPASVKQVVTQLRTAFPDVQFTVEDMVAEGDKVATRLKMRGTHKGEFLGITPTGTQFEVAVTGIDRIAGGQMVERWAIGDNLGLLQQLGALPSE